MKKQFISNSSEETIEFAKEFTNTLKGGEIVALNGELGSGKTVFTKGIARGLGIKQNISSPTFVIMKEYNTNNIDIKKLIHVDAYRLREHADIANIGIEDYIGDKNAIIVIEWYEYIKTTFSQKVVKIKLEHLNESCRKISIF